MQLLPGMSSSAPSFDSSNTTSVSSISNWNQDSLSKVLVGLFTLIILILLACFIKFKRGQKGKNSRSSSSIPVVDKGLIKDDENYSINSSGPNNVTMMSDDRDDSDKSALMEADCIEANDTCLVTVDKDVEKGAQVIIVKRI